MMINIDNYLKFRLSEVSMVLTSTSYNRSKKGYSKLVNSTSVIFCPKLYVPGQMEVRVVDDNDVLLNGYVVKPDNLVYIDYLNVILNTAVSWAVMTEGQLEKKTNITLKRLNNVLVRIIPYYEQKEVANLYYILMEIKKQKLSGSNNSNLDFWYNKFFEVQNAIALELLIPQVFKEFEITLLDPWLRLIKKSTNEHSDLGWNKLYELIGKELLSPQNEVAGNLNKLRVVMQYVIDKAKQS